MTDQMMDDSPPWQGCRRLTFAVVVVAVMLGNLAQHLSLESELSGEEAGQQGLRPSQAWVRWAGICLELRGFNLR